jgi:hypothetical protein
MKTIIDASVVKARATLAKNIADAEYARANAFVAEGMAADADKARRTADQEMHLHRELVALYNANVRSEP